MTTQLGPATITVTLDVKKANEQLAALEKRLKEMGTIEPREPKPKEEEPEPEKETPQAKSRFGKKVAVAIGAATAAAYVVEKILPAVGEGLEGFARGKNIPFLEDAMKGINDKLNSLSDFVSEIATKVKVALPTYEQMKDVTRARMLLGETPTARDISDTAGVLYQVNETQARAQRERDKVVREVIGKTLGEMMAGGAGK
jgi:hypothetical protein